METSTTIAVIIALVLLMMYSFKSWELTNIKVKEQSLQQAMESKELLFKKEIEAVQYKFNELHRTREEELKKEFELIQSQLSNSYGMKEEVFKKELELIQVKLNESYSTIPLLASQQFDEFKKNEIDSLRNILIKSAKESALADLENWKIQYENFYRQDAISRSQSTILGKVTEHLIPFHKNFPYNPKEARFIGSPIDIIVFKGLEEEKEVEIHILEIKTGKSQLSKRQRLIREAVDNNRVVWRVLNL